MVSKNDPLNTYFNIDREQFAQDVADIYLPRIVTDWNISNRFDMKLQKRATGGNFPDVPLGLLSDVSNVCVMPMTLLIPLTNTERFESAGLKEAPPLPPGTPEQGVIFGYDPSGVCGGSLMWWKNEDDTFNVIKFWYPDGHDITETSMDLVTTLSLKYLKPVLDLVAATASNLEMTETKVGIQVIEYTLSVKADHESFDQLPAFHMSPKLMPQVFEKMRSEAPEDDALWWVSEDISTVVWDVLMSGTAPTDIRNEDMPSKSGIMYFDGGVGFPMAFIPMYGAYAGTVQYMTINAVAWTPDEVIFRPMVARTRYTDAFRESANLPLIVSPMFTKAWLHQNIDSTNMYDVATIAELLVRVALRLERQKVLVESMPFESLPSKSKSKKVKRRESKSIPKVTLAILRKVKSQPREELFDANGIEYKHRWIVRGHNRKQPFGSRKEGKVEHRDIWIAPYIKGASR